MEHRVDEVTDTVGSVPQGIDGIEVKFLAAEMRVTRRVRRVTCRVIGSYSSGSTVSLAKLSSDIGQTARRSRRLIRCMTRHRAMSRATRTPNAALDLERCVPPRKLLAELTVQRL